MTKSEAVDRLENIFIEAHCKRCDAEPIMYDCTKGCADLEKFTEAMDVLEKSNETQISADRSERGNVPTETAEKSEPSEDVKVLTEDDYWEETKRVYGDPSGDLISREDAVKAICRSSVYAWSVEDDKTAHDWALSIINALPTADRPSIVRCKDCIQKHIGGNVTHYYWCDFWDREVDCNNGCSWGERKGGDTE